MEARNQLGTTSVVPAPRSTPVQTQDENKQKKTDDHDGINYSALETNAGTMHRTQGRNLPKPSGKAAADGIYDVAIAQLLDPSRTKFNCCYCGVSSHSIEMFKDHVYGYSHRQTIASLLEGKRSRREKISKMVLKAEELAQYSFLALDLENFRLEAVIGLSYVREIQSVCGIKCICHLCGVMFSHIAGQNHVTSYDHCMRFLRKRRPADYKEACEMTCRKSRINMMYRIIHNIEKMDGRGAPKIQVLETKSIIKDFSQDPEGVKLREKFDEFVNQELEDVKQKLSLDPPPPHLDLDLKDDDSLTAGSAYVQLWDQGEEANGFFETMTVETAVSRGFGRKGGRLRDASANTKTWKGRRQRKQGTRDGKGKQPQKKMDGEPSQFSNSAFSFESQLIADSSPGIWSWSGPQRSRPWETGPQPDIISPHDFSERMRQDWSFMDSDPWNRQMEDKPFMDPDHWEKAKRVYSYHESDHLTREVQRGLYFDSDPTIGRTVHEQCIDPDPLRRVLPSKMAAGKPRVFEYGHKAEQKVGGKSEEQWQQDLKDVLAHFTSRYNLPLETERKEGSLSTQSKLHLLLGRSIVENSEEMQKSSYSKRGRNPDPPDREESRRHRRLNSSSGRDRCSPGPAWMRDRRSPGPVSMRDRHSPGPVSMRDRRSPGPVSMRSRRSPGLVSMRDRRSPGPVSMRGRRSPGPVSVRDRRSPGPVSTRNRRSRSPVLLRDRRSRSPVSMRDRRSRSPVLLRDRRSRSPVSMRDRRSRSPDLLRDRRSRSPLSSRDRRSRSPQSIRGRQPQSPVTVRDRSTGGYKDPVRRGRIDQPPRRQRMSKSPEPNHSPSRRQKQRRSPEDFRIKDRSQVAMKKTSSRSPMGERWMSSSRGRDRSISPQRKKVFDGKHFPTRECQQSRSPQMFESKTKVKHDEMLYGRIRPESSNPRKDSRVSPKETFSEFKNTKHENCPQDSTSEPKATGKSEDLSTTAGGEKSFSKKKPEPGPSDDVEDAQADLIAEMLLSMKQTIVKDSADPESALQNILSQDVLKSLLETTAFGEK